MHLNGRLQKCAGSAPRGMALLLAFALHCLMPSGIFAQHTYYIANGGNDAAVGTKSAPWAHLPGMISWTGTYTPAAGDVFVLRGCDTWVNSDFPVFWKWSGSSGSPIQIGVDKAWYNTAACPVGWSRPVFDAQKQTIQGVFGSDKYNSFVVFSPSGPTTSSYGTLDNIEFKGLHCASDGGAYDCYNSGVVQSIVECPDGCNYWNFTNLYVHGWDIPTSGRCRLIAAYQSLPGGSARNNVFDGSDSTSAQQNPPLGSCAAFVGDTVEKIIGNVIHDLSNGIAAGTKWSYPTGTAEYGSNLIYNIWESNNDLYDHENALRNNADGSTIYYVHDNVIYNVYGESIYLGSVNETDNIWNNVVVTDWPPEMGAVSNQAGLSVNIWNNTVVVPGGNNCWTVSGHGNTYSSVIIQNNHCVTSAPGGAADAVWPGTTPTIDHNLVQTPAQAATQGFASSRSFMYSPVSTSASTVGQGVSLSTHCSAGLVGLCADTGYACSYNQAQQTVSCPARFPVAYRPTSGPWDIGAYKYRPSPPGKPTTNQP